MSSRLALRATWLLVALATLAGCEDEPEPVDPCNSLTNDAPLVTPEIRTTGTTPMGGTIEAGRYLQTAVDFVPDPGETYPPDPRMISTVFELAAGELQIVMRTSLGGDERTDRYSAHYTPSGTELILNYSCPDDSVLERPQFTATPSELRLYYRDPNDPMTAEFVFTKQ